MATSDKVPSQVLAPGPRRRRVQLSLQSVMPFVLLLALVIALIALQPHLLRMSWLERKTDSSMTLILVVIGQTIVILTGGIDLSVGGIVSLTNAIAATQFGNGGGPMYFWMAVIIAVGLAAGGINGYIIAYLRVQPFIVTLATWSIWGGLALSVLPVDGGSVPDSLYSAVTGNIAGIPKSGLLLLFVIVS